MLVGEGVGDGGGWEEALRGEIIIATAIRTKARAGQGQNASRAFIGLFRTVIAGVDDELQMGGPRRLFRRKPQHSVNIGVVIGREPQLL